MAGLSLGVQISNKVVTNETTGTDACSRIRYEHPYQKSFGVIVAFSSACHVTRMMRSPHCLRAHLQCLYNTMRSLPP